MSRAHGGRSEQPLAKSNLTSRLIAAAADVAFVLDRDGVILDVSLGEAIEAHPGWKSLVGKRWSDTLATDSQRKVELLLREAQNGETARSREFNQKADGIGEIPLRFNAVQLDESRVVAMGRDLRPIANMQQRMVTAQQAMDIEYGRLRQADTRYRVLFHVCTEGVLVVDTSTRRVVEANPAAAALLGEAALVLQGRALEELFDPSSSQRVQALLFAADAGARSSEALARLHGENQREVMVSATVFRQSGSPLVLLRFWPAGAPTSAVSGRASRMLSTLDAMPDAFVVTGEDRAILCANNAFCELVQSANENQVVGQSLDRWVGRPGVDLNIMLANLREHGLVRNFATIVRSDFGPPQEAVVTAVSALDGKAPCLGFAIRAVSSRVAAGPTSTVMPRSIEQMRELVGRVPLKDLVRESADLIERLCIEAALDVSGNNRASAAQLLGLSRQGLYSKLRRHGLAEFGLD